MFFITIIIIFFSLFRGWFASLQVPTKKNLRSKCSDFQNKNAAKIYSQKKYPKLKKICGPTRQLAWFSKILWTSQQTHTDFSTETKFWNLLHINEKTASSLNAMKSFKEISTVSYVYFFVLHTTMNVFFSIKNLDIHADQLILAEIVSKNHDEFFSLYQNRYFIGNRCGFQESNYDIWGAHNKRSRNWWRVLFQQKLERRKSVFLDANVITTRSIIGCGKREA